MKRILASIAVSTGIMPIRDLVTGSAKKLFLALLVAGTVSLGNAAIISPQLGGAIDPVGGSEWDYDATGSVTLSNFNSVSGKVIQANWSGVNGMTGNTIDGPDVDVRIDHSPGFGASASTATAYNSSSVGNGYRWTGTNGQQLTIRFGTQSGSFTANRTVASAGLMLMNFGGAYPNVTITYYDSTNGVLSTQSFAGGQDLNDSSGGDFFTGFTSTSAGIAKVTIDITRNTGGTSTIALDALTYAIPETVAVPDLVGLTQTDAESVLAAAYLTVGEVTLDYSDTVPAGEIISQSPLGSNTVAAGSAVDFVVSFGPVGGVAEVQIFDGQFITFQTLDSQVGYNTAAFPDDLSGYSQVLLEVELTKPVDGDYDPWDRYGDIHIERGGVSYEIARFVTAYGKGCGAWIYDITDFKSLLGGEVDFSTYIQTYIPPPQGWVVNAKVILVPGVPTYKYSKVEELWRYDKLEYGNPNVSYDLPERTMDIPGNALAVKVRLSNTGHGQGNTYNAAEFYNVTHDLFVNGSDEFDHHLWKDDCAQNPCNPQFGNDTSSRAGWCPGQDVQPVFYDLGPYFTTGLPIDIDYVLASYTNLLRPPEYPYDGAGHTMPYYNIQAYLITHSDSPFPLSVEVAKRAENLEDDPAATENRITGFSPVTGPGSKLVVAASWESGYSDFITNVIYGSQSFKEAVTRRPGRNSSLWYLDDPIQSSGDVVVRFNAGTGSRIGVLNLINAAAGGPDHTASVVGSATIGLTTTVKNSMVVGIYTEDDLGTLSSDFAGTLYSGPSFSSVGHAGFQVEAVPGAKTYTWTANTVGSSSAVAASFPRMPVVPGLSIAQSNAMVSVAVEIETGEGSGYVLQHSDDLSDTNSWVAASAPFTASTNFMVEPTNAAAFYRVISE
jgi:hypothetical protein